MTDSAQTGRLVIISGPSGSGKSTVVRELREKCELPLVFSVSATTRGPRQGERDGLEYFFLTDEAFQTKRQAGEFLESKQVFSLGHWYGTLADQVATGLMDGKWVILEIDVQGAVTIMDDPRHDPITIFIHPGSVSELERRLRDRATESETAIQSRLAAAAIEMKSLHRYQHVIINDRVDHAVEAICQVLRQSHREHASC